MNSSPANENSPSNRQVQRANSRPAKDDPTKDDSSSTLQDQNANFKPTETKGISKDKHEAPITPSIETLHCIWFDFISN